MQRIKRLKQKLIEGDTALFREKIYREMIGHYLVCLKLVEATRDKKYGYEEDIKRAIDGIESKTKMSVMVDIGRVDKKDVVPAKDSVVDMMRVACYAPDADKAASKLVQTG